jgi:type II secretory pathway component GspD/PulD (secretin)
VASAWPGSLVDGLRERKKMRSPETKYKSLWLACLILAMTVGRLWAAPAGEITNVSFEPEKKRLVISTKGAVGKHTARVIGQPNRLVMDVESLNVGKAPHKINGSKADIHEIRVGVHKANARIVMDFRDSPVPAFNVLRAEDKITVTFGTSLAGNLPDKNAVESDQEKADSPLSPDFVQAAATEGNDQAKPAGSNFSGIRRPELNTPGAYGAPARAGEAARSRVSASSVSESSLENAQAGQHDMKLAQAVLPAPPNSPGQASGDPKPRPGLPSGKPAAASHGPGAPSSADSSGGPQMVREVKAPVTPPTPDPRLLVQEITELRFVQVGHNSRLMIRGGDHLDYRLNKISPTKARLDLINAEVPKAHQQPLKTDLWSTSVEMIVPGSQSIFIQLKDAVPYQVEKQKGVLMVDFPPPRFAVPPDQAGQPKTGTDVQTKATFEESRERRRQAQLALRLSEARRGFEQSEKDLDSLKRRLDDLRKQKNDLVKTYQLTPDPEVFSKPVTMDFQGIAIKNALRLLAEQAGINMIVGNDVQGNVTMRLFQVPLGQVIDTVLQSNNLDRVIINNVMRVDRRDAIEKYKKDRQQEFNERMKVLDGETEQLLKEITSKEEERTRSRRDLEKEETGSGPGPAEIVEDTRTEEIGEAGCVKVGTQNVCFFFTTVTIIYKEPANIVNTLQCLFNLKCGPVVPAAQNPVASETQQVIDQGFSPGGNQGRNRIQNVQSISAQQQTAQAQTSQAQAGLGARYTAGGGAPGVDPAFAAVLANSMIYADGRKLFIKDTAERIVQMKKVIASLDVPEPQVLIESRMVFASKAWSRGLGVQWGARNAQSRAAGSAQNPIFGVTGQSGTMPTATGGATVPPAVPQGTLPTPSFAVNLPSAVNVGGLEFTFGFLQGSYLTDLDLQISLGETQSLTKVIARPKVQVQNNKEATIESGTMIPYPNLLETQFINATLKLNVKPTIYPDGRIFMEVTIQDNAPGATDATGRTQIDIRSAKSILNVKDGDTVVIGGLARSNDGSAKGGWPGLMNMPIISYLFSNKSVNKNLSEMLVFLTPTIIKRPPPAS